jgi:hypothetical protein
MDVQGRNTERTDRTRTKFIKELLRQLLILAMILIGIVASSLPAAFLFQAEDSSASESKRVPDASDIDAHSLQAVPKQNDRLTFAKDTGRQHQRRKTAN